IADIEMLWQKISVHFDKNLFQQLYRAVHSLSGLAGTFGSSKFSQSIRDLEVYLDQLHESNNINATQHSEIYHLLEHAKDNAVNQKITLSMDKLYQEPIDNYKIVYINKKNTTFQKKIATNLNQLGFKLIFYKTIESFLNNKEEKL